MDSQEDSLVTDSLVPRPIARGLKEHLASLPTAVGSLSCVDLHVSYQVSLPSKDPPTLTAG